MPKKFQNKYVFTVSVYANDTVLPDRIRDEVAALCEDLRDNGQAIGGTISISYPMAEERKVKGMPR